MARLTCRKIRVQFIGLDTRVTTSGGYLGGSNWQIGDGWHVVAIAGFNFLAPPGGAPL